MQNNQFSFHHKTANISLELIILSSEHKQFLDFTFCILFKFFTNNFFHTFRAYIANIKIQYGRRWRGGEGGRCRILQTSCKKSSFLTWKLAMPWDWPVLNSAEAWRQRDDNDNVTRAASHRQGCSVQFRIDLKRGWGSRYYWRSRDRSGKTESTRVRKKNHTSYKRQQNVPWMF